MATILCSGNLQGNILAPYLIVSDGTVGLIPFSITKFSYNINNLRLRYIRAHP